MRQRSVPAVVIALTIALGLIASACGSSTGVTTDRGTETAAVATSTPAPAAVPAAAAATEQPEGGALALPAIDVVDLISGEALNLSSYSPPGPTLVWFWAPH